MRPKDVIINMIASAFAKNIDPPETSLEYYRCGKILGKGAFGQVTLAMHKLAKKLVACKAINKSILKKESQKEKLDIEVGILKRFRHPNVVKLYETFDSENHKLLILELCAGGDLLNYVRK